MIKMNEKVDVSLKIIRNFPFKSHVCAMVAEILLRFGQCKECTISLLSIDLHSVSAEFCSIAYSEAPSFFIKTMKSLLDF